mgnify:CR=1 FL=1
MLFPMRAGLAQCQLFVGLNSLLLEVLRSAATSTRIDETVLPEGLLAAVRRNSPTNRLLGQVNSAAATLSQAERDQLLVAVQAARTVRPLFSDCAISTPGVPDSLSAPLKEFATHLFSQTAKLVNVVAACGESVMDHYSRYAAHEPPGNGNVCGMCGTEYLAQFRANVEASEQWRAPYDHLLAKDTYPILAVHPENLIPVCVTCNSKAKLRKDLLHDGRGLRRRCFDPWGECAHDRVDLAPDFGNVSPTVSLTMTGLTASEQDKLNTWDDVYRIKERVEGEFLSIREKLAEDLDLSNLTAFRASLTQMSERKMRYVRLTPYSFWRGKLFRSMATLPDQLLEQLRELCVAGLDPDGDRADIFGI